MDKDDQQILKYLDSKQVDLARIFMKICVPHNLSKFFSLSDDDNLNQKKLNTLKCSENWFALSKDQNDPFDMWMSYIDKEKAAKRGVTEEGINYQEGLFNHLRNNLAICCFTDSDFNNLPMWAYYTNNYHGYCVNYRVNHPEFFYKVTYLEERIGLTNFGLLFADSVTRMEKGDDSNEFDLYEFVILLLLNAKHISWQHEKEFRIINKDGAGYESNDNLGLQINDITVGLNCKKEYRESLVAIGNKLNVPCYILQLDDKKFLKRERIY